MSELLDAGDGELINIVADNSKFHRAHNTGLTVVIVTVPVIIVAIISGTINIIIAALIDCETCTGDGCTHVFESCRIFVGIPNIPFGICAVYVTLGIGAVLIVGVAPFKRADLTVTKHCEIQRI